jgi:hypothetical protein
LKILEILNADEDFFFDPPPKFLKILEILNADEDFFFDPPPPWTEEHEGEYEDRQLSRRHKKSEKKKSPSWCNS